MNTLTVKIIERQDLTNDIVALKLANDDGSPLHAFEAGAHIDVKVSDEITRQYSLCSSPEETDFYRLGILNDSESRGGSSAIHQNFKAGDSVDISVPKNLFPLNMDAEHTVLVGGGIGITPMIAMAYALKAAGKSFTLHYCVKNHEQVAFLSELQADFANQLQLHCDDLADNQRLAPGNDFSGLPGNTHLYTCGPAGFMDWIMDSAKSLGFTDEKIHCEYFNAEVEIGGDVFTVVAEESGETIIINSDQSIAEALIDAGISVDISCEKGICGTCIVDVIEGEPEHRDHFLTDDEKADNDQIAICCSRSKSEKLILDI